MYQQLLISYILYSIDYRDLSHWISYVLLYCEYDKTVTAYPFCHSAHMMLSWCESFTVAIPAFWGVFMVYYMRNFPGAFLIDYLETNNINNTAGLLKHIMQIPISFVLYSI